MKSIAMWEEDEFICVSDLVISNLGFNVNILVLVSLFLALWMES